MEVSERVSATALAEKLETKRYSIQQGILSWPDYHPLRYPWRQQGSPAYEVLIGEMLLERVGPSGVAVHERFLRDFPSPGDLCVAQRDKVAKVLEHLRLEEHRESLMKLVAGLAENGEIPSDSDKLADISGLDSYGVKAVFCFGYSLPVAIVDRHVLRMLRRIFFCSLPYHAPEGLIQAVAESLVRCQNPQKYNSVLLDVAELVCRPKRPMCSECPVNSQCDSAPLQQRRCQDGHCLALVG